MIEHVSGRRNIPFSSIFMQSWTITRPFELGDLLVATFGRLRIWDPRLWPKRCPQAVLVRLYQTRHSEAWCEIKVTAQFLLFENEDVIFPKKHTQETKKLDEGRD